ncbi:MAG: hypothetical protein O2877_02660, partial [bacterium]|nr:hypothetical protein [bacterium]
MSKKANNEEKEKMIEEELRSIYEGESGTMPDLSSLDEPKRSWRKTGLLVAFVLLVLSGLIWVSFFFFGNINFSGQSEHLKLTLTARAIASDHDVDEALTSGVPSRIAVSYQNISNIPIASMSVRVNLPPTFVADHFVPEPTEGEHTWQLGSLAPQSDGMIEIFGTMIGDVPSTEKAQVIATYRPANFSSDFDAILVENLAINASALELQFNAVDKAVPGESVELSYILLNTSTAGVDNIVVQIVAPAGFSINTSEPPIVDGLRWVIPRLESHSKTSMSLTGTFSGNTRGLYDIGGDLSLSHEGLLFKQAQTTRPIDVFGGTLTANIIVNGSARSQNVDPGSTLRISIPYENGSEVDMQNLRLELDMNA